MPSRGEHRDGILIKMNQSLVLPAALILTQRALAAAESLALAAGLMPFFLAGALTTVLMAGLTTDLTAGFTAGVAALTLAHLALAAAAILARPAALILPFFLGAADGLEPESEKVVLFKTFNSSFSKAWILSLMLAA
jgi:hypothetical protein